VTQRDVVLRWIEQIAKVVARLLNGPGQGDLDLAADQVEEAIVFHLGPLHSLMPRMDVRTAADLVHDADRLFGYAQLLALRAAVEQARGEPGFAETSRRALAFAREAVARTADAPPAWKAWVAEADRALPAEAT
jgi:hypothetical protein